MDPKRKVKVFLDKSCLNLKESFYFNPLNLEKYEINELL